MVTIHYCPGTAGQIHWVVSKYQMRTASKADYIPPEYVVRVKASIPKIDEENKVHVEEDNQLEVSLVPMTISHFAVILSHQVVYSLCVVGYQWEYKTTISLKFIRDWFLNAEWGLGWKHRPVFSYSLLHEVLRLWPNVHLINRPSIKDECSWAQTLSRYITQKRLWVWQIQENTDIALHHLPNDHNICYDNPTVLEIRLCSYDQM